MNSFAYLHQAASISGALSRLLATDFSKHRFEDLPHACRVNDLVSNWFLGDRLTAWRNLYLLEYFAKHLSEIQTACPDVLQDFRREFRRARLESQFFGLRFEAYVAASFVRKGVKFDKDESPDFRLNDLDCNVECTITHIAAGSPPRDLSYKVTSAIRKKAETASHRSNCALFIDVTNLLHSSLLETANSLRAEASRAVHDTDFFGAVLFAHMFNAERGRLETIYFREDNGVLSSAAQSFLDTNFPVSEDRCYEFFFPHGG